MVSVLEMVGVDLEIPLVTFACRRPCDMILEILVSIHK
jgi:hypothetical protein